MLAGNVARFERAYDDLTYAVSRAKKVCKAYRSCQSSSTAASQIPKEKPKRGRPKGSKDSKPRNHARSKSTCTVLDHDCKISGIHLSSDQLVTVEVTTAPKNCGCVEVDGRGDIIEMSSSDSFFSHDDCTGPAENSKVLADVQHSIPACWILPLP